MGYYVETRESTAYVPMDKVALACDLGLKLMGQVNEKGRGGSFGGGKKIEVWFSWVDTASAISKLEKRTPEGLAEFFAEWSFDDADVQEDGVHLNWYNSKTGQEEEMLTALAPALTGELIWQGEEGEIWRQKFEQGTVKEQAASIIFPD